MKNNTVKSICEYIWELEEKHQLVNLQINDVFIWSLVRMKIFEDISLKLKIYDEFHPSLKKINILFQLKTTLIELIQYIYNSIFLLKRNRTIDKLILPTTRTYKGKCIYLNELINTHINTSYMVETSSKTKYKNSLNFNFIRKYAFIKAKIKAKFYKIPNSKELSILNEIELDILNKWGVTIHLKQLAKKHLLRLKYSERNYIKILSRLKIKTIYLVCFYSSENLALISAANKLGIKVIELQHGVITPYHLGYSYPKGNPIPYAPSELLLFGKYWQDNNIFPSNIDKKIVGFKYFEQFKNKNKNKIKNQLLFTSEGPIGKKLFKIALEVASLKPELNILFKLHPSEIANEYFELLNKNISTINNLSIVGNEINTYDLMIESEYQAGVSSTTLFEGLSLGNKIILLDLSGSEYMDNLKSTYNLIKVKTAQNFVEQLKHAKIIDTKNYLYKKIDH